MVERQGALRDCSGARPAPDLGGRAHGQRGISVKEFRRIDRLPPYVFSLVNDLKAAARRSGEDVVDLGMGNPDLASPEPVVDKLAEAARDPRNHRYSTSRGLPNLRQAIMAAEDDQFEQHIGLSIPRIVATLIKDIIERRKAAGVGWAA